jgi:hypothetical protein
MSNVVFSLSLNQRLTVDLTEFGDQNLSINEAFSLYKDHFPFEVHGFRKKGSLDKLTGDEPVEAGATYTVIPTSTGDKG